MENLSQTKKARAARRWRKQTRDRKRYEGTLKEFIKVKYDSIYQEYNEFYQILDKSYPNTRELFKTPKFEKWAKGIRREEYSAESDSQDSQSDDKVKQSEVSVSQSEVQPDQSNVSCEASVSQSEVQSNQSAVSSQDHPISNQVSQQDSDVLSTALHEALSGIIPTQEESFEDVEAIINELEQDIAVQAILDPFVDAILNERDEFDDIINDNELDDDDEGIELNLVDEIETESFDYNLEIDF